MSTKKLILIILLIPFGILVLGNFKSSLMSDNVDPTCCDPGSEPASVGITGWEINAQGMCCLQIQGYANYDFEIEWSTGGPICTGRTDGIGYAECCISIGSGLPSKFICIWTDDYDGCATYHNNDLCSS